MFEPSLKIAFGLIDRQSEKLVKLNKPGFDIMCLCGGLGSSEYVWKRFKEYSIAKLQGKCAIFTDSRAWSAVVRGAATRGLCGSLVLSKTAKRAYGIGIHQEFREGIDDEEDAWECPTKGKRANGYVYYPIRM